MRIDDAGCVLKTIEYAKMIKKWNNRDLRDKLDEHTNTIKLYEELKNNGNLNEKLTQEYIANLIKQNKIIIMEFYRRLSNKYRENGWISDFDLADLKDLASKYNVDPEKIMSTFVEQQGAYSS